MLDGLSLGLGVVVMVEEEEKEEEEVVMDLVVVESNQVGKGASAVDLAGSLVEAASGLRVHGTLAPLIPKLRLQVPFQVVEESFKAIALGQKARPHTDCRFLGSNSSLVVPAEVRNSLTVGGFSRANPTPLVDP